MVTGSMNGAWLIAGAFLAAASAATARPFTNTEGKTIEAAIVGASAGVVTLKLPSGKTARVPLETLSEPDRKFVELWLKDRIPRLRVTPKLIRANRDDDRGIYYFDEERQLQVLNMTVEVENEDNRQDLDDSELKYILVGRSVVDRHQYKILAVQRASFDLGTQQTSTITFKTVKNIYNDGDYNKGGHRCIGYVLHATRKSDGREVYAHASTTILEQALLNIVELKSGDLTDDNFIKLKANSGKSPGNDVITVE